MSKSKTTRKFAASTIAATAAVAAIAPVAIAADTKEFTDVKPGDSHYEAITALASQGVIKGYPDDTFKPNEYLSRSNAAVLFVNALGYDELPASEVEEYFSDVTADHVYAGYIAAAAEAGIFKGSNGEFQINNKLSREAMASAIVNAFGLTDNGENVKVNLDNVSETHKSSVQILANYGITNQTDDFRPKDTVTRGQFATFLYKALQVTESQAPEVVSVSAINAKEIVVKFNNEVDVTTAETVGNYVFSEITGSSIGANPASAEVLADGKSVKLTLGNPIAQETTFTTTVTGVKVKGTAFDYFPQFAVATTYKDEVKAGIVDVTSLTNGESATSVTIEFSEPVASATFKVNGSVASNVTWSADRYTATLSGLSLDATKSHIVEALNVTDYANNVNSLVTKSFNVTKDVVAPNVTISSNSDNQLILTFDKKMNPATINGTNIKVKDELLSDLGVSGFTAVDSSNKKFAIDLPAGLYTSKSSRTFTVLLNDSLEDYLGNKLSTQFQTVTVSKDTVAPTLTNISFVKNPSTGNVAKLVLNFNEGLAASAGLSTAGIKVVDPDGADVTASFLAANSDAVSKGDTSVEITVNATVKSGKYTFYIPTGFATDMAQTPNNSVAATTVVDFGTAASGEFKIKQSDISQTPSNTTNTIVVDYGRMVKGGANAGSATDVNNYTLNGAPLPAGTVITLDSATYSVATIVIPDETIAKTDTAAVLSITGVQDITGKVITPFIGTTSVTDSVSPVLSTASLNTNGTFTIGFGETLTVDAVVGDFDVVVNGKTIDAAQLDFTNAVGADAGKYVIGVKGVVSDNGTTEDPSDDFLYIDANNDGQYNASDDIKVTGAAPTAGVVDLNLAVINSVEVSTKAAGPLTGADAAGNTLKLNVTKTVK